LAKEHMPKLYHNSELNLKSFVFKSIVCRMIEFPLFGEPWDSKIASELKGFNTQATSTASFYHDLAKTSPTTALQRFSSALEVVRNANPNRALVEAIATGPNPDWTGPMLKIMGHIYPNLDKDTRKIALVKSLNFLDSLRCGVAQENVAHVTEPWLVADIIINRWIYNPGYVQAAELLKKYGAWTELYPHLESTSPFWICFAMILKDRASNEVRDRFFQLFPKLADRTLDAAAGFTETYAKMDHKKQGVPLDVAREHNLQDYCWEIHDQIRKKISEEKWIALET